MKRVSLLSAVSVLLLCTFAASAQENGNWRAANQTARSITGDIGITPEKIFINFARFTMSRIRPLQAAEISAFAAEATTAGTGSLYRLSIPPDQKFLHKNTLCGSEETQWMATYVEGKTLKIAFFSDAKPPVFTLEALQNSTNLCGTFIYTK
jgi:hypothetical protein